MGGRASRIANHSDGARMDGTEPDPRSYSKWTYYDPYGDPYDMTNEKAHIDQDVARVRAELATSK